MSFLFVHFWEFSLSSQCKKKGEQGLKLHFQTSRHLGSSSLSSSAQALRILTALLLPPSNSVNPVFVQCRVGKKKVLILLEVQSTLKVLYDQYLQIVKACTEAHASQEIGTQF